MGCEGLSPSWGRRREDGDVTPGAAAALDPLGPRFGRGQSGPSALPPRQPLRTAGAGGSGRKLQDLRARRSPRPGAVTLPRTDTSTPPYAPTPAGSPGPCPCSFPRWSLDPKAPRVAPRDSPGGSGAEQPCGDNSLRWWRGWAEPCWGSHVWPLHVLARGIVAPGTRLHAQGDMLAPSGDIVTPSLLIPGPLSPRHPPGVTSCSPPAPGDTSAPSPSDISCILHPPRG